MKSARPLLLFVMVSGCAQHHCRRPPEDLPKPAPEAAVEAPAADSSSDLRHVKVYKYDGSLQCKQGTAMPPERMAKQLSGVKIFNSAKKADGLMHIQVCGSNTGMANVFEISEADLTKAESLGFKKWTFE